jgi:hypothetical protein
VRRARLYTGHSLVETRLVESRLKELGLPVFFMYGRAGNPWYSPGGPYEVWIQDASLLDDPAVKETILSAFRPSPFTAAQEDEIAAMPFEDEPIEYSLAATLVGFVVFITLLVAAFWSLPWLLNRVLGP